MTKVAVPKQDNTKNAKANPKQENVGNPKSHINKLK